MDNTGKLGLRVKKYREGLDLTREQLSANTGLSTKFIEDVEDGKIYPPLGAIIKLSRALGQRVGTFMDDQYIKDPVIVKHDARAEETS
ncbi:MAG: helix-turn-helix transcriptional regulator, partial [Candidatus Methanomethylophilaceae archaeon]|nr:helix-turn-helix transcriptional regulator [Candidatus Methanomethylophilaceae archaeon]